MRTMVFWRRNRRILLSTYLSLVILFVIISTRREQQKKLRCYDKELCEPDPRISNETDVIHGNEHGISNIIFEQLLYQPRPRNHTIKIYVESRKRWSFSPDEQNFQGCSVQNCEIHDHLSDSNNLTTYDAVVFRSDVPPDGHAIKINQLNPHQILILFTMEVRLDSPPEHDPSSDYSKDMTPIRKKNWTATLRSDSDIPLTYGYYLSLERLRRLRRIGMYRNSTVLTTSTPHAFNYSQMKSKKVAWFVSNCLADNHRLEYALELAKYIQIDVFGECGRMKCPKTARCWKMLKKYQFYLSFENANCDSYITEKLFTNALGNDVVPVVMGAPKRDYIDQAPPHSFIHVDDFVSPRELAAYLHLLDKDHDKYNEYFAWKRTGGHIVSSNFWCRLCAKLNGPITPKWYEDVQKWWQEPGICRETNHGEPSTTETSDSAREFTTPHH